MKAKVIFNEVKTSGIFPGDWILLKAIVFTGVAIYFGVCAITEYQTLLELYSGTSHDILNQDIMELPVNQLTELLGSQKFILADASGKEKMLLDFKKFIITFLKTNPELPELAVEKAKDVIQVCTNLANNAKINEPVDTAFFEQCVIDAKKYIKEIQNRKTNK
jgi:hypothetical protein